jgi:hypothetical protein
MTFNKQDGHRIKAEISNRKFVYHLSSIFVIIILIRFYSIGEISYIDGFLFTFALVLALVSKFNEKYIKPIKKLWLKFSLYLSKILNPLILLAIFLICFLPIGIIYKLSNKNSLKTNLDKKLNSYWEDPEDQIINFE